MKALIVGLGQVGSATAWLYDKAGWTVHGCDTNPAVIEQRTKGIFPKGDDFGDLRIDCPKILDADYDAVVICVPTPAKTNHDISYVESSIKAHAWCGKWLIIRATMPIGGTRRVAMPHTLYIPEIRPVGKMTMEWPLVLWGSHHGGAYPHDIVEPYVRGGFELTDTFETIEFAKLAINVYLSSCVSLANALQSAACEVGVDYDPIERILRHEPRIGKGAFVQAGLGFGGTCLPKDLRGFIDATKEPLFRSILMENDFAISRTLAKVVTIMRKKGGRRILQLGITFKPQSECLIESPALELSEALKRYGFQVTVHDPYAGEILPAVDWREADLVILATPHPEFYELWHTVPEDKRFCPISNPFGVA